MLRVRAAQRFSGAQVHGCAITGHATNCTEAITKPGASSAAYFAAMQAYYPDYPDTTITPGLILFAGFDVGDKLSTVADAHVVLPKRFAYCLARFGAWPMSFLFLHPGVQCALLQSHILLSLGGGVRSLVSRHTRCVAILLVRLRNDVAEASDE